MRVEKNDRLQVRITPQLKKNATKAAQRRGLTLSAVISNLLVQFVEAEQVQRGGETGSI